MARVRWTGDGDRQVPVEIEDRVEQADFPRMEWVDVPYATARSLAQQDGWELEASKKAAKTRAKAEQEETTQEPPATAADGSQDAAGTPGAGEE